MEIPGVTDANQILEELGKPGSLYFIAHKGSDGSEIHTFNGTEYVLNKPIKMQKDGSIVLTGTEVKNSKSCHH